MNLSVLKHQYAKEKEVNLPHTAIFGRQVRKFQKSAQVAKRMTIRIIPLNESELNLNASPTMPPLNFNASPTMPPS